ncbi:MAG: HAMP domain-containing sensor histidine kinase [Isosphaeraceae bacterium]
MPKWPIRIKLIAGLSLVVGMMLTLMGGSIFGLNAFHSSNLTLTDQLPEFGAARDLLQCVVKLDDLPVNTPSERARLMRKVRDAQDALVKYFKVLEKNANRGNRADDGRDEFSLAFLIDYDLAAIQHHLVRTSQIKPILSRSVIYFQRHPKVLARVGEPNGLFGRIEALNLRSSELLDKLYGDSYAVLQVSSRQYRSSRIIVWSSAVATLAMLCGLMLLFHHWVLYPIRLLHRGVRRVARGSFDYKIDLKSGDEMQALAEAFNDMTARLSATYTDLERQVHERSRQLVRSEQLAGVGFLAAGVAHEINNPLASIAFCSEALENRLAPKLARDDDPDAKILTNYLRMIQEEAFRCKRITEKLLDFSRCGDIQRRRIDLASLIQSVAEMVKHMGKYRSKTITFHPREAVMAHADEQEIKQVVLNLVVNALDCMEPGGTLSIRTHYAGGMAEMVFADDGCGMASEVLENIFEPFYTRRRVGKGTGLGLSITHRIISQHHGEIAAASPGEGQGATFTVRLPVRPAETTSPTSESAKGSLAGAGVA